MNVDIYSVQPESKETQILLKKSVIQSIKIQTDSFEAGHQHEQLLADQRNDGQLYQQKIKDDRKAEELKAKLEVIQQESLMIKDSGEAEA